MNGGTESDLPDIRLSNFRLLSVLGRGGMGTVYLAEQQNPKRKVAVKIVAPTDDIPRAFLDALKQEGDIAARFEHDNLAHVYECGIVDDHYYLAMQYLGGGDLEQRLIAGMSLNEVRSVITAIASALQTIHAQGFVHRDIKPGNILFSEAGKPVLADFGIAKTADSVGVLTSAGYTTGTPAYMSPEQIRGEAMDGRSDLYSLGIVLYQCLSGELPFMCDSEYELKEKQVRETPAPLTGVLARFQPVVDRLLAKNPDDRYADAAKLIDALDALGTVSGMATRRELTGEATPVRPPKSTPSPVTAWFKEMTGRRVFRVLALYVAVAWGLTEIVGGVADRLAAVPAWVAEITTVAFIVGLPVVLLLAWLFDVGPGGVRRMPTRRSGLLVGSLALAVLVSGTALVFRYLPDRTAEPTVTEETTRSGPVEPLVLAVLPFENLSADRELGYLGRAIAQDLLDGVAGVPGLRIKGTASSFLLAGQPPPQIGETLGVNRLITGTFQLTGDTIRISMRLLEAASGEVVASEVFSDELADIYRVQEQIVALIAQSLGLNAPAGLTENFTRVDPEAYRRYLVAREQYVNPFTDTEPTIERIDEVLELDPDFPEALVFRGMLDIGRAWIMEDRESPLLTIGRGLVTSGLELDPAQPEGYAAMALAHALAYEWEEARAMADRAVELANNRVLNPIYNVAYNNLGHFSIAQELSRRRFQADPLDPGAMRSMLQAYNSAGDDEGVLQMAALLEERDIPYQRINTVGALARSGDLAGAIAAVTPTVQRWGLPEGTAAGYVNAMLGESEPQLVAVARQAAASGAVPLANALWMGMNVGAPADWVFETASAALAEGKLNQIAFLKPENARYRQDPRFVELMEGLGLADYWRTVEPPDFCREETVASICP